MDETIPYTDTIMDAEGGDRARFGDITLTGGTLDGYYFQPDEFEGGEWVPIESDEGNAYYNEEDHIYYSKQDGDLVIALFDGEEQFVDSVLVKNWADGELGIHLTLVDNRPGGGGNSPLLFDGGSDAVESVAGSKSGVDGAALEASDILQGAGSKGSDETSTIFNVQVQASAATSESPGEEISAVAVVTAPLDNIAVASADQIALIAA